MRVRLLLIGIVFWLGTTANAAADLSNILQLGKWSKTDLEWLISADNYENNLKTIQEAHKTATTGAVDAYLDVDYGDSRQLTSLFLTQVVMVLLPQHHFFPIELEEAIGNAANNPAWNPAGQHINKIARPAFKQAKKALKENVVPALRTLEFDEGDAFAKVEMQLVHIFLLAYMAEAHYLQSFVAVYQSALDFLMADANYSMTTDEVLNYIGEPTWNSDTDAVAMHPAIVLLKEIILNGN